VGVAALALGNWAAVGQTTSGEMTLAELRAYMDVLHIKEADEQGVRAQMKTQVPEWFPANVKDAIIEQMLSVDFAALEYPFVKSCGSSADIQALMALFSTPEGQAYARKATGTMVAKEAAGTDALEAHEQMEKEDRGLPPAALNRLTPAQRERVLRVMKAGVVACLSNGFKTGSQAVSEARTSAVQQVVHEHGAELGAAKRKYDESHTAAPPQ
jgi:hypothetical protein